MDAHTMKPINWNAIEERIRPHVHFLRELGFETTGSCGHDMWIMVDLAPARLPDLEAALVEGGYKDFEITYTAHHGFHRHRGATVRFGGDLAGDQKPFDLVLLKVDPEAHPIYFVITARRWPSHEGGHDAYFYDEHTCPTNWTDQIVAVVAQGDEDPHGFAHFVRRIEAPADMDARGYGAAWASLFPEVAE